MDHQIVIKILKLSMFLFVYSNVSVHSQNKKSDYFSFQRGGKKYLKPIKYILIDLKQDIKKIDAAKIFFYSKGERFEFSKTKHNIDTCSVKYLKKIELNNISELNREESLFYLKTIQKTKKWKENRLTPMPLTKFHQYFKIFIIERYKKDRIIKYEVDWDYSGTRGFKVK